MYSIYANTDIGVMREHNEDCYLVNGIIKSNGSLFLENLEEFFIGVADGMGGANAGEIASNLVLDLLRDKIKSLDEANIYRDINEINNIVLEVGKDSAKKGMGSTLVAVKLESNNNVILNVGDSRAYVFRADIIRQLSKDHTLVQQLYELGELDREEMKSHEESHILTQCIGGNKKCDINPHLIFDYKLRKNDVLLLCSDGLYNKVNEDEMEKILSMYDDIKTIGDKLIQRANELGGDDNISIVLVKVI